MLAAAMVAFGCQNNDTPDNTPDPGTDPEVTVELGISEEGLSFGGDIESQTITVESNCNWVATVVGNKDWVSLDPRDAGEGETEVTVTVTRNGITDRSAEIYFTAQNGEKSDTKTLSIEQEADEPRFEMPSTEMYFASGGGDQPLQMDTNYPSRDIEVEVTEGGDWCSAWRDAEGDLVIRATLNVTTKEKTAKFTVSAGSFSEEVNVSQGPYTTADFYNDGEVVCLHEATKGDGINIILMGDGYRPMHMGKGGAYESIMRRGVKHFFSVYPFSDYREYFNIWMVTAISESNGISGPQGTLDTKFKTRWSGGTVMSTTAEGTNTINDYARKVTEKLGKPSPILDLCTVVLANADVWAGTTLSFPEQGYAQVIMPVLADDLKFKKIFVHEVCGHGYGMLADEYFNAGDGRITATAIAAIEGKQRQPIQIDYRTPYAQAWINLDVTGTSETAPWADFIDKPGYEAVGMYEGAYNYATGVWRAEQESCMGINNMFYFNAPSRWVMMRRIMMMSGEDTDYTVEEFMADDKRPVPPSALNR